jgi:hypothetical protein
MAKVNTSMIAGRVDDARHYGQILSVVRCTLALIERLKMGAVGLV